MNGFIDKMDKSISLDFFSIEKSLTLMDMVDKNNEMMYQEASVNVYAFDRSYDDLCNLYEAADSETAEKKKGLFSTIIEAIGSIMSKIGEAISGFFDRIKGKTLPDKVRVSEDDAEAIPLIQDFGNRMGAIKSAMKDKKRILAAFGIGTAVVGSGAFVGTKLYKYFSEKKDNKSDKEVEVNSSDATTALTVADKITTDFKTPFNTVTKLLSAGNTLSTFRNKDVPGPNTGDKSDSNEGLTKEDQSSFTEVLQKIRNFFAKIWEFIKSVAAKLGATISDNAKKMRDKLSNLKPKKVVERIDPKDVNIVDGEGRIIADGTGKSRQFKAPSSFAGHLNS